MQQKFFEPSLKIENSLPRSVVQNLLEDINAELSSDHSKQVLSITLNIIQFRRWNGSINWEKEVLANLISHFGEEAFLTVCKELSIQQRAHFKTRDSGGSKGVSFETIYYDLKPYDKDYIEIATKLLTQCKSDNMDISEDMHYSYDEHIVSNHGDGNALPLFTDNQFLKAFKETSKDCYSQYIKFIGNKDFLNTIIAEVMMPNYTEFLINNEGELGLSKDFFNKVIKRENKFYLQSFTFAITQVKTDVESVKQEEAKVIVTATTCGFF